MAGLRNLEAVILVKTSGLPYMTTHQQSSPRRASVKSPCVGGVESTGCLRKQMMLKRDGHGQESGKGALEHVEPSRDAGDVKPRQSAPFS